MEDRGFLLEQSRHSLEQLIAGKADQEDPLSPLLAHSEEERAYVDTFNLFLQKYQEAMQFVNLLCNGQLEKELPMSNQLIGSVKQLQSELRHLVWQTQRLAAGDLNQQVYFLGDFSEAFNHLIASLQERKDLQEQVFKSEEHYKTLLRISPDGITLIDLNGVQQFVSEKGAKLFGFNTEELIGRDFSACIIPEHREKAMRYLLKEILQGDYTGAGEYQMIHKDGTYLWIEANAEVVRSENGEPEAIMLVYRDITRKKQLEQQSKEYTNLMALAARMDRMTGMLNRFEGLETLRLELQRNETIKSSLSISYVDMDGLKYVNDHLGHSEGDRMILALASGIQSCVRNTDYVSRLGGDEFLIIFPDCDLQKAEGVMARLQAYIDTLNHQGKVNMPLSFSYGIAVMDSGMSIPAEQLIRMADEQMYIQKRNKKDRAELS
jgi:diguanylate cyclase (GGDEF)-like protein/PAS domain S-box-containing protein